MIVLLLQYYLIFDSKRSPSDRLVLAALLLLVHAVYLGEALHSRPWHDTGGAASSSYTPLSLSLSLSLTLSLPKRKKKKNQSCACCSSWCLLSLPPGLCVLGVAGAYDDEEAAARAYDLAALKYWGPDTILNLPVPPQFIGPAPLLAQRSCSSALIPLPAIS